LSQVDDERGVHNTFDDRDQADVAGIAVLAAAARWTLEIGTGGRRLQHGGTFPSGFAGGIDVPT
jgi:hypothetical protein